MQDQEKKIRNLELDVGGTQEKVGGRMDRACTILPLVAIIVVCNLSGGSECFWSGDTHHDSHNHTHPHPVMLAPETDEVSVEDEPYLLEHYELESDAPAGVAVVPSLRRIEGISFENAGVQEVSPASLREFSARVLEVNDDLLGVPEHAGILLFVGVRDQDEFHLAVHGHVMVDWQGNPVSVPGSLLTFVFDASGRLLEISSSVRWHE